MSHDTFSAFSTERTPCPCLRTHRKRRPKNTPVPLHENVVSGPIAPSARPASAITVLKTDPGEYKPWMARFSSTLNGFDEISFHVCGVKRFEYTFGLNSG